MTPEQALELELSSVTALAQHDSAAKREPFSIVFRVAGRVYVPQKTYRIEHAGLGALEIFLVPIMPDERGMRLEAIFN